MKRSEAVVALVWAAGLVTAGLVWLFGAYALVGCGLALGLIALLVDVQDDDLGG